MFTRLLFIALLAVTLASAKSYTFSLANSSKAGSTTLKAGQYTVKLDGSKVTLKDATGRDVAVKPKVETASTPYKDTEVSVTQSNGSDTIEWIGLGGSKSKIVFE